MTYTRAQERPKIIFLVAYLTEICPSGTFGCKKKKKKKKKISSRDFQGPTPSRTCPRNVSACIKNHYVQGRINHRCIGSFMYKRPQVTLLDTTGIT